MTPKMLDHITIRGFRSIAAVERLELRALNVLIGANGSGKSNFLEVFKFLRKIREGRLQDYIGQQGGADSILHFGGEATPNLDLDLSFGGGVAIVEVGSDAGMPCARTSFVISARTGRASPGSIASDKSFTLHAVQRLASRRVLSCSSSVSTSAAGSTM